MWRELVEKTNLERNPKQFWKEVGRMMGISRGRMPETLKDENGRDLNTGDEVETAFRNRLIRTFNISDEENEAFCEETEGRVER